MQIDNDGVEEVDLSIVALPVAIVAGAGGSASGSAAVRNRRGGTREVWKDRKKEASQSCKLGGRSEK